MILNITRCLGVSHVCGSTLNLFILSDIGKMITHTTVQHKTSTEVKNTELQQLIRDYHVSMHNVIGAVVVIDPDNDNVFIFDDETRERISVDNGAYYGFEKDVDVDESVGLTSAETEVYMYNQYIAAELRLTDKYGMNRMARFC